MCACAARKTENRATFEYIKVTTETEEMQATRQQMVKNLPYCTLTSDTLSCRAGSGRIVSAKRRL